MESFDARAANEIDFIATNMTHKRNILLFAQHTTRTTSNL